MTHDHLVVSLKYPKHEQPPQPQPAPVRPPLIPEKKSRVMLFVIGGVILLALAGIGIRSYVFHSAPPEDTEKNASDTTKVAVEKETNDLVTQVGALIVLPQGETPTIATVSDPEKLKDQTFFASANVGDKVLLYMKAHKAYLYRPSLHRLVEVAPIKVGTQ